MKKFGAVTVFDLLIKYIKEGTIKLDKSRFDNVLATYHDPCNYGRKAETLFGHGYFDEPRWILDQCMDNWIDLYPTKKISSAAVAAAELLPRDTTPSVFSMAEKKWIRLRPHAQPCLWCLVIAATVR